MKAKPVQLVPGVGYVQCAADEATHVTLNIPGPTGKLTLPVIQRGTRDGTGCWTWNGSTDAPTLRPSVATRWGDHPGATFCHSWINDGAAQFLTDSTHELAGQTVPLLDVPPDESSAGNAGVQPVDGVEVLADEKPLPQSEWDRFGIERADLLDARSGTVTAFVRHGQRIRIQATRGVPERVMSPDSKRNNAVGNDRANPQGEQQ